MTPGKPLEGLLVVSMEQAVAAPTCSVKLADAGARVIKIERAEGDFARGYDASAQGQSSYFVWLNRGKESVCLDIKDAADKALLERLVAKADVFIQNLAPGAMARAGFGSAALREKHPRLITVDISGYGETGDYATMKAYDLLVQAESGLASITGHPAGPGRVGFSVCDIACGTMAHAAVLEARREQGCSLVEMERSLLGFDHALAGSVLGRAWRFPHLLAESARAHHSVVDEPTPASKDDRDLLIVALADRLAHRVVPAKVDTGFDPALAPTGLLMLRLGLSPTWDVEETAAIRRDLAQARAYLDIL